MEDQAPLEYLRAAQEALPPDLKLSLLIGEGGYGVVYKARHRQLDIDVAVKILKQSNPVQFRRFQVEAANIAQLDHPNIVKIRKFGVEKNNSPFIVYDFIEGETLAERLARGPVNGEEFRNIFVATLKGLEYAHSKGILHRDLKPSNIMLCAGDAAGAKLVDFGISKNLLAEDQHLTGTQDLIGTPQYMSPEQCNNSDLDSRSDMYSMACIMYEVICGSPPFNGETAFHTVLLQSNEPPPSLLKQRRLSHLPKPLLALIDASLAKSRTDRPSIAEVIQMLQAIPDDWTTAQRSGKKQLDDSESSLLRLRHRLAFSVCAFIGLASLGVFSILHGSEKSVSALSGIGAQPVRSQKLKDQRKPMQKMNEIRHLYMEYGFDKKQTIKALDDLSKIKVEIIQHQSPPGEIYQVRMLEGILCENLDDFDRALLLFQEATKQALAEQSPAARESLLRVADVYTKLGHDEQAMTELDRALSLKCSVVDTAPLIEPIKIDGKQTGILQRLHLLRAKLHLKTGNLDEAEADLKEILKQNFDPHFAHEEVQAYYGLAEILDRRHRKQDARAMLDKALKLFPALSGDTAVAEVAYNMSLTCAELGEFQEAEKLLLLANQKVEAQAFKEVRALYQKKIEKQLEFVRSRFSVNSPSGHHGSP